MIKDFIPKHVSCRHLLAFLERLSGRGLRAPTVEEHLAHNRQVWNSGGGAYFGESGYVEYQAYMNDIWYGKKKVFFELLPVLRYGGRDKAIGADYNCCEVIALYNALRCLGIDTPLPDLIAYFERHGITLSGYFGTSVRAITRYLDEQKISYSIYEGDEAEAVADNSGDDESPYIITVYNDIHDITAMIHTMCITREHGMYVMHNTFRNRIIRGRTIEAVVGHYGDNKAGIISLVKIH